LVNQFPFDGSSATRFVSHSHAVNTDFGDDVILEFCGIRLCFLRPLLEGAIAGVDMAARQHETNRVEAPRAVAPNAFDPL
jgi:hypothetical protein